MESDSEQGKQYFRLGEFEGPLDLLLYLIKKNEINIYDIPISQITEQYLEYLAYATQINLENITEFYVMAATLLYIKSQTLLPVEVDFDDDLSDPRRELVDKLIEYQRFKKISQLMTEREHETEWIIERNRTQATLPFPDEEDLWERLDVWELLRTFTAIMGSLSSERVIDLYEEITLNEKLSLIYELLEQKSEFHFTDLLVRSRSTLEVVCAFLAILEAVKARQIAIYQNRLFGDIRIRRHPAPAESEVGAGA